MPGVVEKKFKVVLLGDGGAGKTSLVKRFVLSRYDEKYIKTLGTNIYKKQVVLLNGAQKANIDLQIWDVMGQNSFMNVIKTSLTGANGIIFVTDLTNANSLKNLGSWIKLVQETTSQTAFVFIANKSDLDNIAFGFHSIKETADKCYSPYYITSAKSGDNVNDAFNMIASLMLNQRFVPPNINIDAVTPVRPKNKLILVEDNIINTFCSRMGGYEKAMPIVRKQFEVLGIDFENPTKAQLQELIQKLLSIMQTMSDDELRRLKSTLSGYLREI